MTSYALRRLRLRPGEEHREAVSIALEPFELGGQRYLPVPADAPAELTVARATSGDVFGLRFDARLHGPCMRCLADAALQVAVGASEYQDAADDADEELGSEYVAEGQLALSAWARDAIALALPDQILCRPDCAGLCPVCGKDLNVDPHEHEDVELDSRWEALQELRDRL